jgi:hypothetical protein
VPALAILLAGGAIAFAGIRWRRRGGPPGAGPAPESGAAGARLEADIEKYDL